MRVGWMVTGGETASATIEDGSWIDCGVLVGDAPGVAVGVGVGVGGKIGVGVAGTRISDESDLSRESAYGADGMLAELPLKTRKPTPMMLPQMKIVPRTSASHFLRTVQRGKRII